jgi:Ca2+-binding RTX toxin-like protein
MAYNYFFQDEYRNFITDDDNLIFGTKSTSDPNGGNDVINALGGNDHIYAKFGDDIVDAGRGNDLINGGWGDDTFYFGPNSGYDVIKGFGRDSGNEDTIVVEGNYNGYYVSPITDEVVLKFDHNGNGRTDARVLLSGVYESEWRTLEDSVIVDDTSTDAVQLAKAEVARAELQNWNDILKVI